MSTRTKAVGCWSLILSGIYAAWFAPVMLSSIQRSRSDVGLAPTGVVLAFAIWIVLPCLAGTIQAYAALEIDKRPAVWIPIAFALAFMQSLALWAAESWVRPLLWRLFSEHLSPFLSR